MNNSEVTWSSVEMHYRDRNTVWYTDKNGIPRYEFRG
jgi:hypothetical protein